jgi:regulator of sigma E protease
MALVQLILQNFFSFILIISVIVFVHEFGHFFVARFCGVKVDEFALGFGKKLIGFRDKKGTEWKFCLLPFGGYVKMYGDRNGASMPDLEAIAKMSPEDRQISFVAKTVYQRMAIVAAGPAANFILAIFLFTFLFKLNGLNTVAPVVDEVLPQSAAMEAGLKKDDRILVVDGKKIKTFDEMREVVVSGLKDEVNFTIQRANKIIELKIAPKIQLRKDFFGEDVKIRTLGISASQVLHTDLSLWQSFRYANSETYRVSISIFKTLGELITGKRSVEELGGPIKIAKYSGKTFEMGISAVVWFMAMISINLGAMNLLPIPVLDGGHLFFYFFEAIFKKPLSQKTQQIGFKIGLGLILALMIFTTFNDIRNLIN